MGKEATARVLIYDIENMAVRGWAWGLYEQNLLHIDHQQHLLCLAYKWLGEKKVHTIAIWDYKLYKKDPHSDLELAKAFHKVMDEADVVVGHNSDSFDNKMVNAMFLRHNLPPPSPYAKVDTKTVAKRYGRFISNKLDDLGNDLGIGRKMKHEGFDLWINCDNGVSKAHKKMLAYNVQDVKLTERLYLHLRPWIKNHPRVDFNKPNSCPKCGSTRMQSRGYLTTSSNVYRRYYCANCGGWAKQRTAEKITKVEYV